MPIDKEVVITAIEWFGSFTSLLGGLLVAVDTKISKYGWAACLIGNIVMVVFAWSISRYGFMNMQIGFTCISLVGLYRKGFRLQPCSRRILRLVLIPPQVFNQNTCGRAGCQHVSQQDLNGSKFQKA